MKFMHAFFFFYCSFLFSTDSFDCERVLSSNETIQYKVKAITDNLRSSILKHARKTKQIVSFGDERYPFYIYLVREDFASNNAWMKARMSKSDSYISFDWLNKQGPAPKEKGLLHNDVFKSFIKKLYKIELNDKVTVTKTASIFNLRVEFYSRLEDIEKIVESVLVEKIVTLDGFEYSIENILFSETVFDIDRRLNLESQWQNQLNNYKIKIMELFQTYGDPSIVAKKMNESFSETPAHEKGLWTPQQVQSIKSERDRIDEYCKRAGITLRLIPDQ